MEQPARRALHADRWVALIRKLAFVDFNFTGATFAMQVRQTYDAPGAALITLGTVGGMGSEGVWLDYAGTDTVLNHLAAGRLREVPPGLTESTSVAVSVVGIRINKSTMGNPANIPFPAQRGEDLTLAWDLLITPSGGVQDKYIGGHFIVRGGATQ